MSLSLNNVLIGSVDPAALAAFYTRILGDATWQTGGWVAWDVGDGFLALGPHSDVTGDTERPVLS